MWELLTSPISQVVFSIFGVLAVLDFARPARRYPRVRGWRAKGLLFFGLSFVLSSTAPVLWDAWFAEHRLIDARGLGHVGGAAAGFLGLQLAIYGWHRLLHRVPLLWRWSHQMHHSAERIDVFGALYFHPLDTVAFALVTSATLVLVLGVTVPAAIAASVMATFCSLFQHANLRTPRWLGYLVQRPESHAIHHQRGVHAWNYGDIPLFDMLFGTFRNPPADAPAGIGGFWDGASGRVLPMLLGRDVTQPPEKGSSPRNGVRHRARTMAPETVLAR